MFPPKLKGPDTFSIPCMIGNVSFARVLYDLGLSFSLIPYSIFRKLDLGQLQPTPISL